MHNLGILYFLQQRHSEAEPIFKETMNIGKSLHEPALLMSSINHLGVLLSQGRYSKAEPLFTRALTTVEKAFGPEDPFLIPSLKRLAALYKATGREKEERLLRDRIAKIEGKIRKQ